MYYNIHHPCPYTSDSDSDCDDIQPSISNHLPNSWHQRLHPCDIHLQLPPHTLDRRFNCFKSPWNVLWHHGFLPTLTLDSSTWTECGSSPCWQDRSSMSPHSKDGPEYWSQMERTGTDLYETASDFYLNPFIDIDMFCLSTGTVI
jgi:hypothetical protein